MSLGGLVLGVINAAIVGAILLLIGALIVMVAKRFGFAIDWNVQQLYLAVVALIVLYMIIALLFGLPSVSVVHSGPLLR